MMNWTSLNYFQFHFFVPDSALESKSKKGTTWKYPDKLQAVLGIPQLNSKAQGTGIS